MEENKKTRMIVVAFLLVIVVVSSLVMFSLYKAQAAKAGPTKTITR
ncbi:MAG: hypothetical protein WC841_03740 [Candidatus Shapirobacteria bacterium]|jgi:hypothetical protein